MSLKNNAIIYARVSKSNDPKCMSLNSQEHACSELAERNGFGIFKTLKDIGSAFSKPQTDLKNVLKSCKNKLLIVFDPSRLSRNLVNFREIYKICERNKHSIAIVSMNTIYDYRIKSNYKLLYDLINHAQQESIDLGRRISRSYQYRKSKELPWGKMKNELGITINNETELKISHLIKLLNTEGSSVETIQKLINDVGKMEGKDPFEIVEYTRSGVCNDLTIENLPYPMAIRNIVETLNIYEVPGRHPRWRKEHVCNILSTHENVDSDISEILMDVDLNTTFSPVRQEWLCVWYDPSVGLPPNVVLPEGMTLPKNACTIYIPK